MSQRRTEKVPLSHLSLTACPVSQEYGPLSRPKDELSCWKVRILWNERPCTIEIYLLKWTMDLQGRPKKEFWLLNGAHSHVQSKSTNRQHAVSLVPFPFLGFLQARNCLVELRCSDWTGSFQLFRFLLVRKCSTIYVFVS